MFQGHSDVHDILIRSQIADSILIIGVVDGACIDTVVLSVLAFPGFAISQRAETRIQTSAVV